VTTTPKINYTLYCIFLCQICSVADVHVLQIHRPGYAFEEEKLPNPLLLPLRSYEPMQWRLQRWKSGGHDKGGGRAKLKCM